MRRSVLIAAALLSGTAFAGAADVNKAYKAPAPVIAASPYSGFYIGITGGAGFANRQTAFVTLPGDASGDVWPAGVLAGITTGYSFALGAAVMQIEADWNYSFNRQSGQCAFVGQCDVQDSFLLDQGIWVGMPWGTITGAAQRSLGDLRVAPPSQWPIPLNLPTSGWAATLMPKIGAGVSERNVKVIQSDSTGLLSGTPGATATDQAWLFGWWVGAGLEMPVAAGWSIAPEYKYRSFNKSFVPANSVTLFGPFAQQFRHLDEQTMTVKVKLLF